VIFIFNVGVMDTDVLAYGKVLSEDASFSDFLLGGGGPAFWNIAISCSHCCC
jgi:hypothetical protein